MALICTGHMLKLGMVPGMARHRQNPRPKVSSACSRQAPLEFLNIHKPTLPLDGFLQLNPAVQLTCSSNPRTFRVASNREAGRPFLRP